MKKFNVFIVLSIIATASIFIGASVSPIFAQGNSTIPMSDLDNMTMSMNNTTIMTGNSTNATESEEECWNTGQKIKLTGF